MSPRVVDKGGTAVTALGGGRWRIEKTGAGSGYDASAASIVPLGRDFVLRAESPTPDISALIGATANPDESLGFEELDHAAQLFGPTMYIYERGTFLPPSAPHGGAVWIERQGSTLSYRSGATYGGSTVRRTLEGVSGRLYFDSTILTPGGVIEVSIVASGARPQGGGLAIGCGI
jgi:hypothetical protein